MRLILNSHSIKRNHEQIFVINFLRSFDHSIEGLFCAKGSSYLFIRRKLNSTGISVTTNWTLIIFFTSLEVFFHWFTSSDSSTIKSFRSRNTLSIFTYTTYFLFYKSHFIFEFSFVMGVTCFYHFNTITIFKFLLSKLSFCFLFIYFSILIS